MSWGNQGRSHYVYGAGDWSKYYWSYTYNHNAVFSECMANCTTYAYGRVQEEGQSPPVTSIVQANYWHEYVNTPDWTTIDYYDGMILYPGDVVEWDYGIHVAVVETQGSNPMVSASWYTGDHGKAEYPPGSGQFDTRSTSVMGSTLQSVSDWMVANAPNRFYHYNTLTAENNDAGKGRTPKYVLRFDGTPTPPEPSVTPSITITPPSYSDTMNGNSNFIDFTYTITITGIPSGEVASGGNTYPDLVRQYNTGWSYTPYTVSGVTYQIANKTQTLRYTREHDYAYTTVKHMYFNLTFSNGSINTDTPMYINVLAKTQSLSSTLISVFKGCLGKNKHKTIMVK